MPDDYFTGSQLGTQLINISMVPVLFIFFFILGLCSFYSRVQCSRFTCGMADYVYEGI
jgi:hypothetical protein